MLSYRVKFLQVVIKLRILKWDYTGLSRQIVNTVLNTSNFKYTEVFLWRHKKEAEEDYTHRGRGRKVAMEAGMEVMQPSGK